MAKILIDDTTPKLLKLNWEKYGDRKVAIRHKEFGIWREYTWKDYYTQVKYLALGLLSFGFKAGDKIAIIGDNAPQWYYTVLAAHANHGAPVGIYSDLTAPEVKYIAGNSDSRFAIVEDQEQVDKFLEIKDELPLLQKVIYWDAKGLAHYNDPILISYEQVLQLGKDYEETYPGLFEQNIETGKGDDIATLCYTSGTSGVAPKGAILTYRQLMRQAKDSLQRDPYLEDYNIVSYLPPAFVVEQAMGITAHLISGCTMNFPEEAETQQQDIREIAPEVIFYGSRMWESQAAMVQAKIIDSGALNRFVYNLLLPIGYKIADLEFEGKTPNLFWRALYTIANVVLFRPLRDSLGLAKVKFCFTGGTMLSPDAFRFYHVLRLPLKSTYASTEGGNITLPRTGEITLEGLGTPHIGGEIRITDEGEIINRQESVFSGYYRDPEMTAQVLKDGWFYSGDAGFINDDGQLIFMDRVKDLIELSSGAKLAPQLAESRLRFSPYIKDAWGIGGKDKEFASAVIVIDYGTVGRWAEQRRITYTTFTDLSQKPEVYELVKRDIIRVNRALPQPSRIKRYVNLHKEFDPDEAELTRSRKLRRGFMEEKYSELVDAIYGGKDELAVVAEVKYRDGRTGTIKTSIIIRDIEEVAA